MLKSEVNSVPKYKKKPIIIDAVQFKDDVDTLDALSKMGLDPVRVDYKDPANPVIIINTLEGDHIANVGDYIIKGIQGEFYPCKPDIFKRTYELVK